MILFWIYVTLSCVFAAASHVSDVIAQRQERKETLVGGLAPKFIRLPTDLLVAEGEDAVFECAVTGEPKPDLKWYSDDREVTHNGRILVSVLLKREISQYFITQLIE